MRWTDRLDATGLEFSGAGGAKGPSIDRLFRDKERAERRRRWDAWLGGGGALLGFGILILALGTTGPEAASRLPDGYARLAASLADNWREGREGTEAGKDDAQLLAEMNNAVLELKRARPADEDVRFLTGEPIEVHQEAVRLMERLAALPRPPEMIVLASESFLRGLVLDAKGLVRRYDQVSGQQEAILAEVRRLAATIQRAEAAKLMLPQIAARFGGPPPTRGQVLRVDLDAAWGPIGPDDWLTLTSNIDAELHNCTVLVEVRDATGGTARSVHFVPTWKRGAAIHARYSAGEDLVGLTVNRQTVSDPVAVTASISSDEASQQGIGYTYAGPERDADIGRYCEKLTMRAAYRRFQPGFFRNTERGAEVRFDGLVSLPPSRLTVTFHRGSESRASFLDLGPWNAGSQATISPVPALPWDPDHFTIELTFQGSDFRPRWQLAVE